MFDSFNNPDDDLSFKDYEGYASIATQNSENYMLYTRQTTGWKPECEAGGKTRLKALEVTKTRPDKVDGSWDYYD